MGYYLLDNPPARDQFRSPRRAPISGVVVVHNSGGRRTSAANLAGFIQRRSDPGSYHELGNHRDDWIVMAPDDVEAYGCATGDNRHAWHVCLTGNDGDFAVGDAATEAGIFQLSRRIVAFWQRQGITNPVLSRTLTYDEAHNRKIPGIIHHGVIQPADRSDLWAKAPQRKALDARLLERVREVFKAPEEEEEEVKPILLADSKGRVWLVFGNTKSHVPSPDHMRVLEFLGVQNLAGTPNDLWLESLGTLPSGL